MLFVIILCLWVFTFIDIHLYYTLPPEYRKKTRKYQRWHDLLGGGVVTHYFYHYHYPKYRINFDGRNSEIVGSIPVLYNKKEAFIRCDELNLEYEDIHHWVEPFTQRR